MLGRLVRLRGRPSRWGRPHTAHGFHTSRVCWDKVLRTFKLADIGEGITECEVIKWFVLLRISDAVVDELDKTGM